MFQSIIFSKDRACQLHTLLDSFPEDWDAKIIYTFSSSKFEEGYKKLAKHYNRFEWIIQEKLSDQVLDIAKKYPIIGFITDDSYFWKKPLKPKLDNVGCYTTRMGFNTIVQDPFKGIFQSPLTHYIKEEEYLAWNTHFYHPLNNYGFITAMDGHYYNSYDILNIVDFEFDNPSQFETRFFNKKHLLNPWMRSETESSLVNIPLNSAGGHAQFMDQNIEEINDLYLEGKKLSYIYNKIEGCHQILDWKMNDA